MPTSAELRKLALEQSNTGKKPVGTSSAELRRLATGEQYQGLFRSSNIEKAKEATGGFFSRAWEGTKAFVADKADLVRGGITGEYRPTLSDFGTGVKKTAAGTVNLVTDVAKGFNEGVVRFGKSGLEALPFIEEEDINAVANSRYNPWAGFSKAATGKSIEEINSFQEQGRNAERAAIERGATPFEAKAVGGAAIVGSILLDNPISGGGKALIRVGREGVERLIVETTEEGVERILREEAQQLTEKEIKALAPRIAAAQNRDAVADAFRQGTKRNVQLIDNAVEDISKTAKNSLENDRTGVREKSVAYFKENPAEITASPIRLREVDGQVVIEDGRHRLDAAREAGIKNLEFEDVTPNYTGEPSRLVESFKQNYLDDAAKGADEVTEATETAIKATDEAGAAADDVAASNVRFADEGEIVNLNAKEARELLERAEDDIVYADPNRNVLNKIANRGQVTDTALYVSKPAMYSLKEQGIFTDGYSLINDADAAAKYFAKLERDNPDIGSLATKALSSGSNVPPVDRILTLSDPLPAQYEGLASRVPRGFQGQKISGKPTAAAVFSDGRDTFGFDPNRVAEMQRLFPNAEMQLDTLGRLAFVEDGKVKGLVMRLADQRPVEIAREARELAEGSVRAEETPAPAAVSQETPAKKKGVKKSNATNDLRTAKTSPEGMEKAAQETNQRISHIDPEGVHNASKIDGEPPIKKTPKKASEYAQERDVPLEVPEDTRFARFRRNIQDKMYRLRIVQEAIEKKKGVKLSNDVDAYLQQELYVGRAAERIERFEAEIIGGRKGTKGLMERMKDDGISVEQMGEYLHARHAAERNAKVATINENLPDGGSGMLTSEAEKILAKADPKMAKYADEVYEKITKARLKILEEEGLMKPEAIENIRKSYENYVPLKVSDKVQMPSRGASGFDVRGKDIKRVKGGTNPRHNPLVQAIVDYEDTIVKAEKNRVGKTLKKLIEQHPDKKYWKVEAQTYKPVFNELGEVEYVTPAGFKLADNVLEVREAGKIYHITLEDKALAEGLRNLGTERGIKWLQTINGYLRGINTVFNPEFVITNFQRDIQTALINIGGENGGKMAARVAGDVPSAMRGIWREVRGKGGIAKEGGINWTKEYEEFKEAGGRVGYFNYDEVGERTKDLVKQIERYGSDKTYDQLRKGVDSIARFVEGANESVESAVRLSAYVNAKRAGMSVEEAAQLAKNLTVNFNKKGNWGVALNSFYLFANAGIQGSTRVLRLLKSKKGRKIVAGVAAFSWGLNEMNRAINEEEYDKIPDYEKDTNWIFMLPQGVDIDSKFVAGTSQNGKYIKIKLPYGFNIFKVMGDIIYDQTHQKATPMESISRLFSATNNAFNPLQSGSILQMLSPTISDPVVQVLENKNFAGNPLKPEQAPYAPASPESTLYFSTVRNGSKAVAKWLNDLTGGNRVESGVIDISPEYIDHFIDFIGGGVAQFIYNGIDSGVSLAKGDLPEIENMPFVRKFVGQTYENVERSKVYDILDKSEKRTISDKEKEQFKTYLQEAVAEGQITKDSEKTAIQRFKSNQARLVAGDVFEEMLKVPKEERAALAEDLTPDQKKELAKIIKAYKKEKEQEAKKEAAKNGTASSTPQE